MAKYNVTHSCGHTSEQVLFGKGADRERRLDWLSGRDCAECYKAAESKRAAESVADMVLPDLEGSLKQVAWANTIRGKLIGAIRGEITEMQSRGIPDDILSAGRDIVSQLATIKSAKDWIDNRDMWRRMITGTHSSGCTYSDIAYRMFR